MTMTTTELLFSAWRFDPVAPAFCAAALAGYVALHRLPRDPSRVSPLGAHRAVCLSLAVLVLFVALLSPIGTLADGYLFSAHMLQHLLLLLVIPPLSLMGLSAEPASPTRSEPRPPSLAAPGAWLAGVSAMWVWHAPTLCNAATRSATVHLLQEASLLALGTWFFWPILAPRREDRLAPLPGIAYLLTACMACTLLGIAVTFSPIEVCSAYLTPIDALGALPLLRGTWGLTPERDQQIGGLLMWLPACLVYGGGILGILARWYAEPEGEASTLPEEVP
jgi:putative membrane protein